MDADELVEACEPGDRDSVRDVLAGRRSYDSLPSRAQAVVRSRWSAQMTARISALDMGEVLRGAVWSVVELDDDGGVVHRRLD